MAIQYYQAYPATCKVTFTCAACGKPKRTKAFREECTVNPFNVHPDGTPLTPREVSQQSREQVEERCRVFMGKPVCSACEGELSYDALRELRAYRKARATRPTQDRSDE